ncbi:2-methylcitrate synthase [uncultured Ruminococcus sp.]|uniref:citrate/2-methylcitrate synthase n=1 Tax=Huintestinicola butyrica TaxID=2981728 RepID=UPI0008219B59|nr:citrate/2-methylcitrate synthase [Huintestinicola butyrica]MCU6729048.1 citrate/2-methylcitrate synthase [Huintestinicola butyrica]SCJ32840.1 2-methylcitrate synthase [uncultured Ruminococcus sp.]
MGDINSLYEAYTANNKIDPKYYEKFNVKRGLRNPDGSGVMAGVTNICNVHGYVINEGEKSPDEGKLVFRGYNINDLVSNVVAENRFGYEEIAYLLLGGKLPTEHQLENFRELLDNNRELPEGFFEDMILKAPSKNIMNKMSRAVLALYSYDDVPDNTEVKHEVDTAVSIIAKMPVIMVSAYHVKQRYYNHKSMFMHPLIPGQSTAETILSMLRPDRQFTDEEAKLLDVMLMLHAEHGGGNNSTFTCRVLTSSGTDPYAAYSAAIGSLKGPRHGGANHKVIQMHQYIKENVKNWDDEGEVADFLRKILRKEAGDGTGLIYGMGHAVYTLSDPRAVILKQNAAKMAIGSEFEAEYRLLEMIERLTPELFKEVKGDEKKMCANVDMYSGFVYKMLGIPEDLFTPLFAVSRMAGWCAHRFEESMTGKRIIRPAYKSVSKEKAYIPLNNR